MPSIDLGPLPAPYFPRIFISNQFLTKTQWPPIDTDLSGKVAIVTGANTGLGLECARQLLSFRLSRLILAVRTLSKGETAAAQLREKHPASTIDVWALDMGSYESVLGFAKQTDHELQRLDIAILNAGQYNLSFQLNPKTGHEETVQVNYLSTALLAILLLPLLRDKSPAGSPGRLTIVNAALAYVAKFPNRSSASILQSLDDPKEFIASDRYPTSKLLMHLFMYKLGPRIPEEDVIVNLVCPGLVKGTSLQHRWPKVVQYIAKTLTALPARSVEVGASTYIDAAHVKGPNSHGSFVMNWQVAPFVDLIYEPDGKNIADKLWAETLKELHFANVEDILNKTKAA